MPDTCCLFSSFILYRTRFLIGILLIFVMHFHLMGFYVISMPNRFLFGQSDKATLFTNWVTCVNIWRPCDLCIWLVCGKCSMHSFTFDTYGVVKCILQSLLNPNINQSELKARVFIGVIKHWKNKSFEVKYAKGVPPDVGIPRENTKRLVDVLYSVHLLVVPRQMSNSMYLS